MLAVSLLSGQEEHRCAPRSLCTERGPCPESGVIEADGRRLLRRPGCWEVFISYRGTSKPLRDIW